jgi:O-antigen/teichoic acid export membrane protein
MSPNSDSSAPPRARIRGLGLGLWLWAVAIPAVAIAVDVSMRHVELPMAVRVLLALAPLVPGVFFVRGLRRVFAKSDELALHVTQEAFSFVFFGLIGVMISVDLLRNAGVLSGFVWTTGRLSVAMVGLLLLGTWLANRRYR